MQKPPLRTPEFIVLFSMVTALTALSIDAILPALRIIGEVMAVDDPRDTQLIVTLFIFGMVFGELMFGPLSDALGRKPAIVVGLLVFVGGCLVSMTANSIEMVLLGRVIQGVGASGPKVASRALIRDQYEGAAMARIMSYIFMVFILVPMLAPALGQAVLVLANWRAIFLLFLGLAAVSGLWLQLRQPETLLPERRIRFSLSTILANSLLVFRHPPVMAYTFAAGLIFGALLIYLSTAQALFADLYGVEDLFPLFFAMLALGVGFSSFMNSQLVMRFGMHHLSVAALTGMMAMSALLFAVARAQAGVPPFPAFMIICFLMFSCIGILFGNLNALAMQSLGRIAGLGASIIASVSSLVAVVLSVAVGRFYDQTAEPLALGFFTAGALSLGLVLAARRSTAGAI
jgi:MFS transporter, DHA1 family, multidrug resistance protein